MLITIILWIISTFLIATLAGILGKRYGAVYPIALVSALVVMANIFANKIVIFGPFTVPAGVITFSMIFFITDILSERWGKAAARKAVWAGFFSNLVLVLSTHIVTTWQPAAYASEFSVIFSQVVALTPRIALAGFIAYLISQHHDIWAFHFWKKKTRGKHLWLRNNASTITSQMIDSVIFITIAFYGVFPIAPLIIGQWAVKTIIALIDTPFIYLTLWLMDNV
ncbi:queuosine precursor transporter [Candidatus Woesearchaeota archaeon]|nr:queuosine precursor transporter [Candidatus Woesearchaeota archaeon]